MSDAAHPPDPYQGQVLLGKYRCMERLGSGTTATVYKIQHARLGHLRAIKIFKPELRNNPEAAESFWREVRLAESLRHPNIAVLHDVDALPDGSLCSIWEHIDGPTLGEHIRKNGPLGADAATLTRGLCGALQALHENEQAHLDLCPENIVLATEHHQLEPRLIDFGEARPFRSGPSRSLEPLRPGYSAPEQLRKIGNLDARADVFALGALICFAFTGLPPMSPPDVETYGHLLQHMDPSELKVLRDLPPPLRSVIETCLALETGSRPSNGDSVRAAIRRSAREAAGGLGAIEPTEPNYITHTAPIPQHAVPAARPHTGTLVGAPPAGAPAVGAPAVGAPATGAPATGAPATGAPTADATGNGPRLEPVAGDTRVPLPLGREATLGRAHGNTLLLQHPTVSKFHARVWFDDGSWLIEDTGSRNGTSVNGRRVIGPAPLRDGDTVVVGDLVFRFRS